jgi:hypothetical protein
MNAVDTFAGKISERRKVLFRREPARLEAAHLARRSRCIRGRFSADNPPHRGLSRHPANAGLKHIGGSQSESSLHS